MWARRGRTPDQGSRRAVVIGALSGLVRALENEDSEAEAEKCHVNVVSSHSVTDPTEIADDLVTLVV